MEAGLKGIGALLLLAPLAAAQRAVPGMEHGPPWLGRDLEVAVVRAQAQSPVRLLASDAAGSQSTPYGLLELDGSRLRVVANGKTDAHGRLDIALPIPLDPALAETELHLQALVGDQSAPGGWILSEALHLRRLGARVYAGFTGSPGYLPDGPLPGGLAIVSAVQRQVVATIDYGVPASHDTSAEAQPVFSHDLARGAVVDPNGQLIFFDPFFGGVLATQQVASSPRRLATTDGGTLVITLDPGVDSSGVPVQPALLRAFHMQDGTPLATRDLARSSTGHWLWSPERDEAYVFELDSVQGPYHLRRIGLQGLEDRGSVPLPLPANQEVQSLFMDGASLFLSTFYVGTCAGPGPPTSVLVRVDYGASSPTVESTTATGGPPLSWAPLPGSGRLYAVAASMCMPGYALQLRRLGQLTLARSYLPPPGENPAIDIAWDGSKLWIPYPANPDGAGGLLWFDIATETWSTPIALGTSPTQVEILQDPLVFTGAVFSDRPVGALTWKGHVYFVDPGTGAYEAVVAGPRAESLLGVSLP